MNECTTYLIEAEWAIGLAVFLGILAVAYLSRKVYESPKVKPAYKINGKKHG
jgi:hypothetical protein